MKTAISDASGNEAPVDRTTTISSTATLKLTESTDVRATAFDKTVIRQAILNGKTLTITAEQADNLYIDQVGAANSNIIVYGLEDFPGARFASFYNNGTKTIYADDDVTFTGTLPLTSFNGAGQVVIAAGKTITIDAAKFTANNNKISGDGTVYVVGGEGGVADITTLRLQNVTANINTTSVNDGEAITTMTLPATIAAGKTLITTLVQLTAVVSKPTIAGDVVLVGALAEFYDDGTSALTTDFNAIKTLYPGVKTVLTDTTVDAAHLSGLDGLVNGVIDASAVTDISGSAADIVEVIGSAGVSGFGPTNVTLNDAVDVTQATAIDGLSAAGTVTYSLEDTAAAIQALITADGDANTVLLGADSITADAALDLTVAEQDAYGAVLTSAYNIDDTAAAIQALITADGDANTVLLGADSITADAALDLSIDEFAAYGALLTSAYIITDLADTIVSDDGTGLNAAITGSVNVKLLDQPTLAQLKFINNATSGSITLVVVDGPLSGTAADLTAAFAGTITAYEGTFTVTNAGSIAATVLSGLDAKTSGLLTAANITTLTGTGTEVRAVIDNLGSSGNKISLGAMVGSLSNVAVTLSGNAALTDLLAIDQSTTGAITASGVTALSGSMTNIKQVTDNFGSGSNKFSIGTMTDNVTNANLTVTDASVTAANLLSLDTVTNGSVSVSAGSTITGNDTEWASLVGAEGVSLPSDFNATVTGVVSTSISATLPALLSFIGENTTGEVKVEGTGANNTLNFSSTTYGLTIDGGAGVDAITGTAMDDVIIGGAGNDNITLGAGENTLVFNSLTGIDTIADFNPTDDLIQLAKSAMAALGAVGALTDAEFESGAGLTAAVDSTTRIFYNTTSGALFYDADGSGVGAATQLATLTGAPALTLNDLFIV